MKHFLLVCAAVLVTASGAQAHGGAGSCGTFHFGLGVSVTPCFGFSAQKYCPPPPCCPCYASPAGCCASYGGYGGYGHYAAAPVAPVPNAPQTVATPPTAPAWNPTQQVGYYYYPQAGYGYGASPGYWYGY